MAKNKSTPLSELIKDRIADGYLYGAHSLVGELAVCLMTADLSEDDRAAAISERSGSNEILYTWFSSHGDVTCPRRVAVKYCINPDRHDDLSPCFDRYGVRYWLDDFYRVR